MNLFPEQQLAVDQILLWSKSLPQSLEFKLGGYAGTGKTTVIKWIIEALKNDSACVGLAAFTGKAVSVLRKKGCSDAQTLHSMLYHVEQRGKAVYYHLRESLPFDYIIVDEASMISKELYSDLMSFEIPVLWVGDPGQLEPVGDDINLMQQPDFVLKTIHRQGEGSEILRFAEQLRNKKEPKAFISDGHTEIEVRPKFQLGSINCDQFICGFNKTRLSINFKARLQLGHSGEVLLPDERICILRNSRNHGVFNGMLLTTTKVTRKNDQVLLVDAKDEINQVFRDLPLFVPQFNKQSTLDAYEHKQASKRHNSDLILADYGYCLTGHKSQGSEWDTVCVIEEIWHEKWEASRWRYTTATRAAKKLFYFYS